MQGSLIAPLVLPRGFLFLPLKLRSQCEKGNSVGPEKTEIRATSAKKFKNILWRPIAIVAIAATSSGQAEAQFTPAINYLSNRQTLTIPAEFDSINLITTLLTNQEIVTQAEEIPAITDREDCKQISGTDYRSENERNFYLENCSASYEETKKNVEVPTIELIVEWLKAGGWPEHLIRQAQSQVFCESRNDPVAISPNGLYKGLFGLSSMWFEYAGEDPEQWANPIINARVAWATYNYDLNRGQEPWTQWQCKP
ncbi:MAG: hypothetical protein Q8P25_04290 [Candidatus Curtissbacteria bacterium]|nr:hypothetical protein [Candidatus Curtissbacteria bacterium]